MDLLALLAAAFDVAMKLADVLLEYLKVLAWPLTVLTLALLFKRPLIGILARLRKATGLGMALELEREARALAGESAHLAEASEPDKPAAIAADTGDQTSADGTVTPPDATPPSLDPSTTPATDVAQLIKELREALNSVPPAALGSLTSSRARLSDSIREQASRWSIPVAWDKLEETAANLGFYLGLSISHARNLPALTMYLAGQGLISEDTADLAYRLFTLHLRIQHDELDLSPQATRDFLDTTNNLIEILHGVTIKVAMAQPPHSTADPEPHATP